MFQLAAAQCAAVHAAYAAAAVVVVVGLTAAVVLALARHLKKIISTRPSLNKKIYHLGKFF